MTELITWLVASKAEIESYSKNFGVDFQKIMTAFSGKEWSMDDLLAIVDKLTNTAAKDVETPPLQQLSAQDLTNFGPKEVADAVNQSMEFVKTCLQVIN